MDVLGAFLTDSKTGEILLGTGGKVDEVTSFEANEVAFYLKDFFNETYLCYRPSRTVRINKEELLATLHETPFETFASKNHDDLYTQDFEDLKQAFGEDLKKVVMVSREEFSVSNVQASKKAFLKRALTFGAGMPYGFWTKERGVVGSTPELLFRIQGERLETFALAGTSKKGNEDALLKSSKDLTEHELVVEDIKEKLAPFSKTISSGTIGVMVYKDIIHLRTDITADLRPYIDLLALTNHLSPTAALGGYPKSASLNFLKNTRYSKRFPRRYFGSAFGVIGPDLKQFVVSIRNVQWEGERFFIESGGGVVAASELSKELDEINLKRNTIKKHYL
jgi:isochorismate synthase EntC